MIKRIVFSNFFKSQIMYGYNLNSTYYLTILCIYLKIYLINKEGNRYLHLYTHCAIHMIYSSVQNLIVHLVTLDLKDLGHFCNLSKKKSIIREYKHCSTFMILALVNFFSLTQKKHMKLHLDSLIVIYLQNILLQHIDKLLCLVYE